MSCFSGCWAWCGCTAKEGSPTPTFPYYLDMLKLKSTKYTDLLNGRSTDGGVTAAFPGPGATAYLKHADVVAKMSEAAPTLAAGEIYKGHDLGFIRLSKQFWTNVPDNNIFLASTVEQHAWIRPILDNILGSDSDRWNADDIQRSAGEYIDRFIQSRTTFKMHNDLKKWIQKYLHMVHMNIELSDEEATKFVKVQNKVLTSVVLPECLLNVCCIKAAFKGNLDFRAQLLQKYAEAIQQHQGGWDRSVEDLTLLASAMLDSLMFAGGLSVGLVISCALGTVYSDESPCPDLELNEDTVDPIVWECVRYYSPVVGFPWYDGPEQAQRTILSLASAARDPDVWSEPEEFKLRDLAEHHRLSVAWADKAVDPSNPANSRICPAKHLSLAMATGFLRAWAARKDSFQVQGNIKITPTTPFMSNWEFIVTQ